MIRPVSDTDNAPAPPPRLKRNPSLTLTTLYGLGAGRLSAKSLAV